MDDSMEVGLLASLGVAVSLLIARLGSRKNGGRAANRTDDRSEFQIREHYLVETRLAKQLQQTPRSERRALYTSLYDELFRAVPHHPMLRITAAQRATDVARQYGFLRRFLTPDCRYLEVGAGNCALALRVASVVKQVCAVDVSAEITRTVRGPANFSLILSDGCSIDVPPGSIDLVFSNQLMEHLHPEDAAEQLHNIYTCLASNGRYVCVTPNRLYGPRDISAHFDRVATGFHLREYSASEIRRLFLAAGFSRVAFHVGARGWFLPCPYPVIAAAEWTMRKLPYRMAKWLADTPPLRALLGIRVAGTKAG